MSALFTVTLLSNSFNFSEVRYSDALESSIELSGEITFGKESLYIKYAKNNREILYKDSVLTLKENGEKLELGDMESQRVSQYFEILLLLHSGDEKVLNEQFTLQKQGSKTLLTPKGDMSVFLQMITLQKNKDELKEVKLFLKNSDTITISIEDEIR